MSALVRLPDLVCDDYQRLLDSGADGLLVPRVRNPEEARLAVSRMMFPPTVSAAWASPPGPATGG